MIQYSAVKSAVIDCQMRYSFGIRQIRKGGFPARTKRKDGTTLVATALERICSQRAAHQANESFKPTPLRGVVLGSRY